MPQFRKRPYTVSAEQFWPDKKPWPEGVSASPWPEGVSASHSPAPGEVTGFGFATAVFSGPLEYYLDAENEARPLSLKAGDWIVTEPYGPRRVLSDQEFQATYEPVED